MTMSSPTAAAADDKLDARVLKIAGVCVIGAVMSILDVTVVSIALPTFMQEFSAQYSTVAWTMTAYTLALAAVIPASGWAADRFGTKRLYIAALILFTAGSAACAGAWSIGSLIAFRVIQGVGGGMLAPLGMTIMTHAAGPKRIGRVMAVLGVPMLLGPIGGPILGGWLLEIASWHWLFLINVPIGIVAVILAIVVFEKDQSSPSESFDFVGMVLLSPGLAAFLYGVASIPRTRTVASAEVLIPAIIGLALMAAFVAHAMRKDHPLIDLRLFKHKQLAVAVITMSLFAIAFFGAMLLFPSYFLQVRGKATLSTGLLLAPQGLGAMLSMPVAGKLTDKMGPGKFVLSGIVLITLGMGVFTQVSADSSYVLLLGSLFVMGVGMGATMMPIMAAALGSLTHHEVARGTTLMNIVQQSAGSIGTAVMSVILTNATLSRPAAAQYAGALQQPGVTQDQLPDAIRVPGQSALAEAFGTTFWVALALIALCLIPALLLPRRGPELPVEAGGSELPAVPEEAAETS